MPDPLDSVRSAEEETGEAFEPVKSFMANYKHQERRHAPKSDLKLSNGLYPPKSCPASQTKVRSEGAQAEMTLAVYPLNATRLLTNP